MKIGEQIKFDYTGNVQEMTLKSGIYQLECWGASGGSYSTPYFGGKGGYSIGVVTLNRNITLYCNVGGTTTTVDGGWNGGGVGYKNGKGGGGATDIRLDKNSLYSRIIVAGGGGGAGVVYGGGWYGGGGAYDNDSDSDGRGGGGGSGYILTSDSYKPEGYTPTSEYYLLDGVLQDGSSSMPSPSGGTQKKETDTVLSLV